MVRVRIQHKDQEARLARPFGCIRTGRRDNMVPAHDKPMCDQKGNAVVGWHDLPRKGTNGRIQVCQVRGPLIGYEVKGDDHRRRQEEPREDKVREPDGPSLYVGVRDKIEEFVVSHGMVFSAKTLVSAAPSHALLDTGSDSRRRYS